MTVITISTEDGSDPCQVAAKLWHALTPELLSGPLGGHKQGSRGNPVAQKARNAVSGQLALLYPHATKAELFRSMIPKMLATQGIDAMQPPEHLQQENDPMTLNDAEHAALTDVLRKYTLNGFERDLLTQVLRRFGTPEATTTQQPEHRA